MNTKNVNNNALSDIVKLAKGSPIAVLEDFCDRQITGRLQFFSGSVCWIVRIESGKVTYATHSIEPFDRLVCQLRYMSQQVPALTKEFRAQICMRFEDATDPADDSSGEAEQDVSLRTNDYSALCWLLSNQHLSYAQAAQLVESIIKEAIEPLFWCEEVGYRFVRGIGNPLTLCRLDLGSLLTHCRQRLKLWQLLSPNVWSPYQRPYFFGQTEKHKLLLPELQLHEKFRTILKGFSFRHLGVLLHKDEIKLAGSLMPYISEEVVVLRDPQPPFDQLPKVPEFLPKAFQKLSDKGSPAPANILDGDSTFIQIETNKATYTIACVDDSPSILKEIGRFLDDANFKVVAINDPIKALIQILKAKPDLILLDVTMPKINGYELCRLLRNNAAFKETPIIMVTGNKGLIDRAKAKVSGATDYLTKPFTQEGLLKMVFRHLS